ncbi:MAG: class I SAM-dependent methyltransferase [Nocardioides sp.]
MIDDAGPVARVRALFNTLADDYDQSGVAFFVPIAERLVETLEPQPGERALDVGCGRGAVTFLLAGRVGPEGRVTAVDLAPAMVAHTADAARAAGLTWVDTAVVDATAPELPEASYDVLASSLVLFFLPDPAAALARWVRLLVPGGRLGVTTFGPYDETWLAVDRLFAPYLPPGMLDPRIAGADSPFTSDAGVEALVTGAGGRDVRTVREPLRVEFADVEEWRRWTMTTGQRAMWRAVPEDERPALLGRATDLLEGARGTGSGRIVLRQDVRHTVATA